MSHLHYSDRKLLQKIHTKAVKEKKSIVIYQGNNLLVEYLGFVLEAFAFREKHNSK